MTTSIQEKVKAATAIGAPMDRVDGPAKTSGAVHYSAEYPLADVAYAALVHAPIARGRIVSVESAAAEGVPGVIAVVTHENAPRVKEPRNFNLLDLSTRAPATQVAYLNTDEVSYDGQPVAMVVAETLETAHHAARQLEIDYESLPSTVDFDAELANAAPERCRIGMAHVAGRKGDVATALAAATHSVDLLFSTPPHSHNALEPHSVSARWEGGHLTIWDGTQNMDWTRKHLAYTFEVPVGNVRIISPHVGGAFGSKAMVWPATILAVMAARITERSIRLPLTRAGVYRSVGGRTPSRQRVAVACGPDGLLTALVHTSVAALGRVGGETEPITSASRAVYQSPNLMVRQEVVTLDRIPNTWMRAPGESIGSFALESAIDELSHVSGHDPLDFRLRNLVSRPPLSRTQRFSHLRIGEAMQRGAETFGWKDRDPRPESMRDHGFRIGYGMATAFHPAWELTAQVDVSFDLTGRLVVECAFHEMGMGTATAVRQAAADLAGLSPESVEVRYGDSQLPTGPIAGGSAQTATLMGALIPAIAELRDNLIPLAVEHHASPLRGADPRDMTISDGHITGGDASLPLGEVLAATGRSKVRGSFGSESVIGRLMDQVRLLGKQASKELRWLRASSGAHFCEVAVDPATNEIAVRRWLGVFDIGTVINPKTASSQLRGGIVMGIGLALSEGTLFDHRTGRIMNPSLSEYHMPVHADVPHITIDLLDDPDPTTPLGVLGAGEVGITGAGAAVANAVFHATGKRVTDLPITLDKLMVQCPPPETR